MILVPDSGRASGCSYDALRRCKPRRLVKSRRAERCGTRHLSAGRRELADRGR